MKTIVFCFPPLSFFGEEYYFRTQQIIDCLKKDFHIKVIKSIAKVGQSKERKFSFIKLIIFLINIPVYLYKLSQADIILIFPTPLWYFWITAGKILGKKIVLDHFTTPIYPLELINFPIIFKKIMVKLDKLFYRRIDFVFTHTNTMKKEIINFYQIPGIKVRVIYSLVDIKLFDPKRITQEQIKKIKINYGIPLGKKILLYHGRFHSSHGISVIEKMAEQSLIQKKNYIFIFVGVNQPPQKNKYFLPHLKLKELYKFLSIANLWLGRFCKNPRANRTASSCMLQAMAMGVPVITYDSLENRSIITDNKNGFLINSLSPLKILKKIDEIFSQKQILLKTGLLARETIIKNYSLKELGKFNQVLTKF